MRVAAEAVPVPRKEAIICVHEHEQGPRLVFMNTKASRNARSRSGTIAAVTEPLDIPLQEQLEEIRVQLAWVRDYL
jgi:hypothetical protein